MTAYMPFHACRLWQAKAAAALCNICSETDANRELVVRAGGLPSLIDMLLHP